jgi:hypothetical protein
LAGVAEVGQHGQSCAWRIDRFDLVFYNARHKRWQFFAEDPAAAEVGPQTEGEGLHRYQIRSLLSTFREAVQSVLAHQPSGKSGVFEVREYAEGPAKRHIELVPPSFAEWKDYKQTYLDCLVRTGWYDGVPEPHRLELQGWFQDPSKGVSREAALTFLSLLPILEDWDTWGCFVRARNSPDTRTDCSFPPAQQEWAEPFYLAELDFQDSEAPESAPCRSRLLLGYRVMIEGVCIDLADGQLAPQRIGRADFFDDRYCKYPEGDEVIPYRCYAALVDQIMKKLAAGGPEERKRQSQTLTEERQFVVAYPVATAGRLHFLQVALSPGPVAHSCVDALWNDWQPIHRHLWVPSFKALLQEEIYRITASAFQSEAYDALAIEFSERSLKPEAKAQRCQDALWEHVYHLFPVKTASSGSRRFGYVPLRLPNAATGHENKPQIRLGSEWRDLTNLESPPTPEKPRGTIKVGQAELEIPYPSQDPLHRLIEEHRIYQSILQQKRFLERLPKGLLKAEKDAEDDRGKCLRIAVAHGKQLLSRGKKQILQPTSGDLEELLTEEVAGGNLELPTGREPLEFFTQPRSFGRYLAQAFPGDRSYQLMALRRILQPSLVQQLSEYFETGPVKVLTHPGHLRDYWGGTIDLFNASFDDQTHYFQSLAAEIDRRLSAVCTTAHDTFVSFHSTLVEYWKDTRCVADTEDALADTFHEELTKRRDQHLSLPAGTPGNRWFLLTPESLISPFVAVYNLKTSEQVKWSTPLQLEHDTLCSPYLGAARVFAVEHYCFFPCTIGDKIGWAQSDLWEAWVKKSCGCEIGELYYFDGDTAFLLLPEGRENAGLIYVPILEMRSRFASVGLDSPALVTVFRHWRMDQMSQVEAGGA